MFRRQCPSYRHQKWLELKELLNNQSEPTRIRPTSPSEVLKRIYKHVVQIRKPNAYEITIEDCDGVIRRFGGVLAYKEKYNIFAFINQRNEIYTLNEIGLQKIHELSLKDKCTKITAFDVEIYPQMNRWAMILIHGTTLTKVIKTPDDVQTEQTVNLNANILDIFMLNWKGDYLTIYPDAWSSSMFDSEHNFERHIIIDVFYLSKINKYVVKSYAIGDSYGMSVLIMDVYAMEMMMLYGYAYVLYQIEIESNAYLSSVSINTTCPLITFTSNEDIIIYIYKNRLCIAKLQPPYDIYPLKIIRGFNPLNEFVLGIVYESNAICVKTTQHIYKFTLFPNSLTA